MSDIKKPEIMGANDYEDRARHLLSDAELPSLDQLKREIVAMGIDPPDTSRVAVLRALREIRQQIVRDVEPKVVYGCVFLAESDVLRVVDDAIRRWEQP